MLALEDLLLLLFLLLMVKVMMMKKKNKVQIKIASSKKQNEPPRAPRLIPELSRARRADDIQE